MRSRSMMSSAWLASNTATGWLVIPRSTQLTTPPLMPAPCENGLTVRNRSPARSEPRPLHAQKLRMSCPWPSCTPLGSPVVPEVNRISARASSAICSMRPVSSAGSTVVPNRRRSSSVGASAGPPGSSSTRCSSAGRPAERTRTDGAADLVGEELHGVDAEELAGGDEHPALGAGERVRGLVALPPRADRGDDAARAPHRVGGDHPLPPVRGPDGDAVAGLEPERDEARGDLPLPRVQLGEGQVHVAVDDRVGLRVQVRGAFEHHRQRRPRERHRVSRQGRRRRRRLELGHGAASARTVSGRCRRGGRDGRARCPIRGRSRRRRRRRASRRAPAPPTRPLRGSGPPTSCRRPASDGRARRRRRRDRGFPRARRRGASARCRRSRRARGRSRGATASDRVRARGRRRCASVTGTVAALDRADRHLTGPEPGVGFGAGAHDELVRAVVALGRQLVTVEHRARDEIGVGDLEPVERPARARRR